MAGDSDWHRIGRCSARHFYLKIISLILILATGVTAFVLDTFGLGVTLITAAAYLGLTWVRQGECPPFKRHLAGALQPILGISFLFFLLTRGEGPKEFIIDFAAFYVSGKLICEDPSSLYDTKEQVRLEKAISRVSEHATNYPAFPYPPFVAFLFAPLAQLTFESAYQVWTAASFFLLALSLFLLHSRLGLSASGSELLVWISSIWLPIYIALTMGQLSFVALIILTLFVLDLLDDRDQRTGLWAGLLVIKPHFLPLPLLFLVARRKWQSLIIAAMVLITLTLVSLAVLGPAGFQKYYWLIKDLATSRNPTGVSTMHNLRALVAPDSLYDPVLIGLSLATVLLILAGATMRTHDRIWILAAMVLGIVIVSPHLFIYDLTLVLIAVALIISRAPRSISRPRRVILSCLGLLPLLHYLVNVAAPTHTPYLAGALVLLCLFCIWRSLNSTSVQRQETEK
jgi:hypothetical protein